MLAWSPLLIQKIEIHALGFVLRKLQLNRHREAEVAPHSHEHAQLILYLTGEGFQSVGRRRRLARSGDLFVIPAGVPHGFALQSQPTGGDPSPGSARRRPVCLVLDFDQPAPSRMRVAHRHLPPGRISELHALLARVPTKGRLTLANYPAILAVVAQLLEQTPAAVAPPRDSGVFAKVRELVGGPTSLAHVARASGYHRDHLTRKLKRETGLGLRAHRDRLRLESAQAALRTAVPIAQAATLAGFDDPNYFTRWFRRQTGKSPTQWRR
jgi:AraC-like DNA-binding protein